jgi:hypothetical protein
LAKSQKTTRPPLEFTVHGPYKIPVHRRSAGRVLRVKEFWEKNPKAAKYASSCGCYVFAIRTGGGTLPHYVGQATKSFAQETFNVSNLRKYYDALADYERGRPVVFFVAHPKRKGKSNARRIRQVENFLIQAGWARNRYLQNVQGIHRPKWAISRLMLIRLIQQVISGS